MLGWAPLARTHKNTMRSQLTFHPSHSFVHIYAQGVVKNSYCVVIGSMIGTDSILFRALDIGRCVWAFAFVLGTAGGRGGACFHDQSVATIPINPPSPNPH